MLEVSFLHVDLSDQVDLPVEPVNFIAAVLSNQLQELKELLVRAKQVAVFTNREQVLDFGIPFPHCLWDDDLLSHPLGLVEGHSPGDGPLLPLVLAPRLSVLEHAAVCGYLSFYLLHPLLVVEKVLELLVKA